jgi:hypothetical protein
MRRRSISVAVALALASSAIGCGDASKAASANLPKLPTPLVEGFSSHQPTAEVEDALRRAGKRITVVEDGAPRTAPSKARPPLSVRVVRVSPFELWGIEGDLRLEFLDGALSSTWFFPSDPKKFDAEAKKRSLGAEPSQPLRLQPATELRSDVDYTGARYWAWEDINLRQKLEQWIMRNA